MCPSVPLFEGGCISLGFPGGGEGRQLRIDAGSLGVGGWGVPPGKGAPEPADWLQPGAPESQWGVQRSRFCLALSSCFSGFLSCARDSRGTLSLHERFNPWGVGRYSVVLRGQFVVLI